MGLFFIFLKERTVTATATQPLMFRVFRVFHSVEAMENVTSQKAIWIEPEHKYTARIGTVRTIDMCVVVCTTIYSTSCLLRGTFPVRSSNEPAMSAKRECIYISFSVEKKAFQYVIFEYGS